MTLILDRAAPTSPMLATWLNDAGRAERTVAVKDGRVLEVAADKAAELLQ